MLPQPKYKKIKGKFILKVLGSSRLKSKIVIFNENINSKIKTVHTKVFPFIQVFNQKTNDFATLARSKYHGR